MDMLGVLDVLINSLNSLLVSLGSPCRFQQTSPYASFECNRELLQMSSIKMALLSWSHNISGESSESYSRLLS